MSHRASFTFIFLCVVLDMLALGIMVPVVPKLVMALEGGDHARAATISGVFGFGWALMQFVASPVLGSLSDHYGRRPILLLSSLGLGLDYVLMALAPNLYWLFLGRIISGITAATSATASAYIADITPEEQRASRYGLVGAAFGVGFVVGPAVGGLLASVDLRLPFWVAGAFSLANTLYGFFVLPESLSPENRRPFHWKAAHPLGALEFVRQKSVRGGGLSRLMLAGFLYFLAIESLPSIFVLFTDYRFQWSEKMVGLVLGAVGLTSMVVSGGLTGLAVRWCGEAGALLVGLLCGTIGYICYGSAVSQAMFLAGIPLVGLWALCGPVQQALLSRRVGTDEQGQLQGALSSLRGVSGMLGPLVFTASFAYATSHPGWPPGLPFYLAAGLMASSFLLTLPELHRSKGT